MVVSAILVYQRLIKNIFLDNAVAGESRFHRAGCTGRCRGSGFGRRRIARLPHLQRKFQRPDRGDVGDLQSARLLLPNEVGHHKPDCGVDPDFPGNPEDFKLDHANFVGAGREVVDFERTGIDAGGQAACIDRHRGVGRGVGGERPVGRGDGKPGLASLGRPVERAGAAEVGDGVDRVGRSGLAAFEGRCFPADRRNHIQRVCWVAFETDIVDIPSAGGDRVIMRTHGPADIDRRFAVSDGGNVVAHLLPRDVGKRLRAVGCPNHGPVASVVANLNGRHREGRGIHTQPPLEFQCHIDPLGAVHRRGCKPMGRREIGIGPREVVAIDIRSGEAAGWISGHALRLPKLPIALGGPAGIAVEGEGEEGVRRFRMNGRWHKKDPEQQGLSHAVNLCFRFHYVNSRSLYVRALTQYHKHMQYQIGLKQDLHPDLCHVP